MIWLRLGRDYANCERACGYLLVLVNYGQVAWTAMLPKRLIFLAPLFAVLALSANAGAIGIGTHPGTPMSGSWFNGLAVNINGIGGSGPGLLVLDTDKRKLFLLRADGGRQLIAGTGEECQPGQPCGDGGSPLQATFARPTRVVQASNGEIGILDLGDEPRVRVISADGRAIDTLARTGQTVHLGGSGQTVQMDEFSSIVAPRHGGFVVGEYISEPSATKSPRVWQLGGYAPELRAQPRPILDPANAGASPAAGQASPASAGASPASVGGHLRRLDPIGENDRGIVVRRFSDDFEETLALVIRNDGTTEEIDIRPVNAQGKRVRLDLICQVWGGDFIGQDPQQNIYRISPDGSQSQLLVKDRLLPNVSAFATGPDGTIFAAAHNRIFVLSEAHSETAHPAADATDDDSSSDKSDSDSDSSADEGAVRDETTRAPKPKRESKPKRHRQVRESSAMDVDHSLISALSHLGVDSSSNNWLAQVRKNSGLNSSQANTNRDFTPPVRAMIATNSRGSAVAIWREGRQVRISERSSAWSVPQTIANDTGFEPDPESSELRRDDTISIKVDPAGRAIAAWSQRIDGKFSLAGAIRDGAGSWRPLDALRRTQPSLRGPHSFDLALGAEGHGALTWYTQTEDGLNTLFVCLLGSNACFDQVVTKTPRDIEEPKITLTQTMRPAVVWREFERDSHSSSSRGYLQLRTANLDGSLGEIETLCGFPCQAYWIQLLNNDAGNALLAWLEDAPLLRTSSPPEFFTLVPHTDTPALGPLSPASGGQTVGMASIFPPNKVKARYRFSDGAWGPIQELFRDGAGGSLLTAALNNSGTGVASIFPGQFGIRRISRLLGGNFIDIPHFDLFNLNSTSASSWKATGNVPNMSTFLSQDGHIVVAQLSSASLESMSTEVIDVGVIAPDNRVVARQRLTTQADCVENSCWIKTRNGKPMVHWNEMTANGLGHFMAELQSDGNWRHLSPSEVVTAMTWLGEPF